MIETIRCSPSKAHDSAGVVRPDKVVAELTFGFWRYLLSARYEASLWTPALRHAFVGGLSRATVYETVEHINTFRNRFAHHDPIYRQHLQSDITRIEQLIDWMSPEAAEWAFVDIDKRLDNLSRARPTPGVE